MRTLAFLSRSSILSSMLLRTLIRCYVPFTMYLYVSPDRFSSSSSEGHYKNRILFLKAILSSQEAAELASRIVSLLGRIDREHLSRLIHEYSDEKGNLYLRLDKQRLCQGIVSLSETDAIRIRFRPVKRQCKPSKSHESYMDIFEPNLSA